VFLWTSDEEIGSESSRQLLEMEAQRSDAVFVLEPALGSKGLLKTARKAVGEAEVIVHGRASHAGLAPEKGVNSIHELALQIARISEWNDSSCGISINAGLVAGGTRPNVIPDRARWFSICARFEATICEKSTSNFALCALSCPVQKSKCEEVSIARRSNASTVPNSSSALLC